MVDAVYIVGGQVADPGNGKSSLDMDFGSTPAKKLTWDTWDTF